MKTEYDPECDCGYLQIADGDLRGRIHHTKELKLAPEGIFGSIWVDVDKEGRVLGIEVLGVTRHMPELLDSFGGTLPRKVPVYQAQEGCPHCNGTGFVLFEGGGDVCRCTRVCPASNKTS